MAEVLNLYLPDHLRQDHEAGKVNILSQLLAALPDWQPVFHPEAEGLTQPHGGFGLTYMQEPRRLATLCLRRTYWYPFWRMERTNERWNFEVAHKTPNYRRIPPRARAFHQRLATRILDGREFRREGFVFVPLQGRLSDHRSFQSMSPIAMLETLLERQPLPLKANLHPAEVYTEADHAALARLAAHPRFELVSTPSGDLLAACDFVACQNSSLAFQAMILGKGAMLFAGIDFHHPAGSVLRDGLDLALERGALPPEQMTEYLWWFLKQEAIDAQAEDAPARIRSLLSARGWP
ncbi:hypothetical protein [Gemmobacter serpentinus]|uniref:hypothetical protein n=1 Tax=Gemmobacter serpentinus TaxID=2652247 RepID=UPI00124F30F6|nr:hypothetical protein [Gemmobacter serpentinus]